MLKTEIGILKSKNACVSRVRCSFARVYENKKIKDSGQGELSGMPKKGPRALCL